MANRNNDEFRIALRDISQHAGIKFNSKDRIKIAEWLFKIVSLGTCTCEDVELARQKNLYAQLLRIQVRGGTLHGVFADKPPPELPDFATFITDSIKSKCGLEAVQPIVTNHCSCNGQVYIAIKPMAKKGFLCYMAASPHPFN